MLKRCHRWLIASFVACSPGLLLFSFHPAEAQETSPALLRALDSRRLQQLQTAKQFTTFHDFRFTDQIQPSGITFQHHIVDDAGKNWKPAHYDHGNGIAVADVDGDGLYDIYFVSQLGASELWRNRGGGKFENITSKAGVALPDQVCVTASFADIDNDGDADLFVTTVRHGNHLFENLGGGRFKDISKESGLDYSGHSSAAVFFDFDNDGLLDLFVCNVGIYTQNEKGKGGFYLAITNAFHAHLDPNRTEYSLLYRNLGNRKFREVSTEMNLRDGGWTGEASVCDLNVDGFPDLYVANMQGDDHYYENQRGKRFIEKTAAYFPRTPWGAMGVKLFDYNNDGLMDLYVTDMHSDMTKGQGLETLNFALPPEKAKSEKWCAIQWTDEFLQGASNNIFGNAFYENKGGGKFEEVSEALGVETYWPWGPCAGDLNADGFEDLFVAAGMGYPFRYAINSVLLNENGRKFFDSEFVLGVEPRAKGRYEKEYFVLDCDGDDKAHPSCGGKSGRVAVNGFISTRSAVLFDLDDDGDLDIITNEFNDRPQVLVSNLSEKRPIHWLKVKLVGTASNRDGLGATVKVLAGGKSYLRYHDGKSGYLSQSSLPLYFGLGNAEKADKIEVAWPSGAKQSVTKNLGANKLIRIQESSQ
jgi:hypothetical protein